MNFKKNGWTTKMARKSRRTNHTPIQEDVILPVQSERKIQTALYARLSHESPETDSVETQIMMMRQYLQENPELEEYDIYADSGYSGTNFNRPEFNRLMNDVNTGSVQCILVKDLSRFGRNYIEAGYFIENLLPMLNVRLISINDRFDSSREEDRQGIRIPLKNMINSMYAVDISKKFTDSFLLHSKLGDYKLRTTTYGYTVDKENNVLVKDPETASIVKLIFYWCLSGVSIREITKRLNIVGAPTPSMQKIKFENKKEERVGEVWERNTVAPILTRPTYTGDTCQGRRRHRLYSGEVVRMVDRDEWIVHENTHEALVSHEDYDKVSEIYAKYKNKHKENAKLAEESKNEFPNLFCRKLVCAKCGKKLEYRRYSHKYSRQEKRDCAGYVCNPNTGGCGMEISEEFLKIITFDQIRLVSSVLADRKKIIADLKDGYYKKGKLVSLEKQILNKQKKSSDLEQTIASLYVNLTEGVIDADEYKLFGQKYTSEKEMIESEISALQSQYVKMKRQLEQFERMSEDWESAFNVTRLDSLFIDAFINKIIVSDEGAYEFVFTCSDAIEQIDGILEGDEDESNRTVYETVAV